MFTEFERAEKVEEVMLKFNFERAQALMELMNWKWVFGIFEVRVPTVEEVERRCRELLHDVMDGDLSKPSYIETGGYRVSWAPYEPNGELELTFKAVSFSTLYGA